MTYIDIISGFLGAGKTTFIKKMIGEAYGGQKLVLIENEFGNVNIDSRFLRDRELTVTELNSGCICCSLVGDFTKAIAKAAADWHPDRILIEPSGVGKLTEIVAAVCGISKENPDLVLGRVITVVDGVKCETYLSAFSEFYENQITCGRMLVLSRTQQVSGEAVMKAVHMIRELNGGAAIVTTPWEQLTGRQILEAYDEQGESLATQLMAELLPQQHAPSAGCCHGHSHAHGDGDGEGHHHAEDIFQSWSMETPRQFTQAALCTMLNELNTGKYGAILRAKGVLAGEGGQWIDFDYVPDEQNIRCGAPDVIGKLCVIGVGLKKTALTALFGTV